MSVNRFDRYNPVRSTYQEKQFIPNFDLLNQALQAQQGQYDHLLDAGNKIPQHLQADRQDVLQYKKEKEDQLAKVTSAYRQGIQSGNRARKDFLYGLKQDYSPTGKAYGFEQNYNAFQQYKEQLDKDLSSNRITPETYRAALNKSMTDFGKSYGEQGTFNQFSGYETAEDIDVIKLTDDFLSGWEADTINGRSVGKTYNGQYFYTDTDTQEFVKSEDIHRAANEYINSNPQIQAYLNQLDTLQPQQYTAIGEDGNPLTIQHSDYVMGNALSALSSKYSYLKNTTKRNWQKDYVLEESTKQRNRVALKEMDRPIEHMHSMLYKSGYEHRKVTDATWRKGAGIQSAEDELNNLRSKGSALTATEAKRFTELENEISRLNKLPENEIEAAAEFLSYLESPEGNEQYKGMQQLREQFPRNKVMGKDGVEIYETDAQYVQRLQSAYNTIGEKQSVSQLKYISYDGEEMSNINTQVFGTANYIGDAKQRMFYPIDSDNKPGDPITWTDVKDKLGLPKDAKPNELRKYFGVAGKVSPDNNIHPSGYLVNASSKAGDFVFVAAANSVEDANYLSPVYRFASPLSNPLKTNEFGTGFGDPIVISNGENHRSVVGKVVPKFSEDGKQVQYEEQVYEIKQDGSLGKQMGYTTENGQFVPLTINDIVTQKETANPFANQRK